MNLARLLLNLLFLSLLPPAPNPLVKPGPTVSLANILLAIAAADPSRDLAVSPALFQVRNIRIYQALAEASKLGLVVGLRPDPDQPDWPLAFIDLPTGQVSWHLPAFPEPWDGHSTEEKYARIQRYTNS